MKSDYRIRLEKNIQYPHSVFWYVEKWIRVKKNGYWSKQKGGVAFTKSGAERAAKRSLKKLTNFTEWEKIIGEL